jgi:hypothetical protein
MNVVNIADARESVKPLGYELHPACAIWPQMSDKELIDLATDIKENGQKRAIVLLDGKILDGRNRMLACERVGITPLTEKFLGKDPISFTVSMNLHRRQLSDSQRAMIAAEIANMRRGGDKKSNQYKENQSAKLQIDISVPKAAKLLNVKPRSVGNAKVVIDSGDAKLINAVKDGRVKVGSAARQIRPPTTPLGGPQFQAAKIFTESFEAEMGALPTEDQIGEGAGVAAGTANKALSAVRLSRADGGQKPTFTKAQDHHVQTRIKLALKKLQANYDERVRVAVLERNAEYRVTLDRLTREASEKAFHYSKLINSNRPIFTEAEFSNIRFCLHPDNSASGDKRALAFSTFNIKKLQLTGKK